MRSSLVLVGLVALSTLTLLSPPAAAQMGRRFPSEKKIVTEIRYRIAMSLGSVVRR